MKRSSGKRCDQSYTTTLTLVQLAFSCGSLQYVVSEKNLALHCVPTKCSYKLSPISLLNALGSDSVQSQCIQCTTTRIILFEYRESILSSPSGPLPNVGRRNEKHAMSLNYLPLLSFQGNSPTCPFRLLCPNKFQYGRVRKWVFKNFRLTSQEGEHRKIFIFRPCLLVDET